MRPRVAFATEYDPRDVHKFSGISSFMSAALEQELGDLVRIGPLRTPQHALWRARRKAASRLRGERLLFDRERQVAQAYARQVDAAVRREGVDVVVGPSSIPLAMTRPGPSVVWWADATLHALLDNYETFTNVSPRTVRAGHELERRMLDRADHVVFTSQWAADGASEAYGVDRSRLSVVPYGANLPVVPATQAVADQAARKAGARPAILVFASEWWRKGVDLAFLVHERLRAGGLDASLTIVGPVPRDAGPLPPGVDIAGGADKATPEGLRVIEAALDRAWVTLMPSRADCTPIAIGESFAHGVPVVGTAVGGIPELIREGETGHVVGSEDVDAMVAAVARVLEDGATMQRYAHHCRAEYEQRLAWPVVVRDVLDLALDRTAGAAR